jgi:pimeloyl-ACP methyl ester carboxylesterase
VPRAPIEVDVSAVVPFAGRHCIRGWVFVPDEAPEPGSRVSVACCLAGGTCSTDYFDLQVDGLADYSMAEYLASFGVVTIALDHLGVGRSDRVDDVFLITPELASTVNDFAHRAVVKQLRDGSFRDVRLVVLGVGHSMGGMLATVQQARHETFDGIVVLGHGGDGLPTVLTDDEKAITGTLDEATPAIVAAARSRFAQPPPVERRGLVPGSFLADDVPDAVRRAFTDQQTSLLYTCGLTSMIPNVTDGDKARITVPVFVAFGDHDLTDAYERSAARYRASDDVALYILEGSAHCHNQASTRTRLWDRILDWMSEHDRVRSRSVDQSELTDASAGAAHGRSGADTR